MVLGKSALFRLLSITTFWIDTLIIVSSRAGPVDAGPRRPGETS